MFLCRKLNSKGCGCQQYQQNQKYTELYGIDVTALMITPNKFWFSAKLKIRTKLSTLGCKSLVKVQTFLWNSPYGCNTAWQLFWFDNSEENMTQKVEKSNKEMNKMKKSYNDVFCWVYEEGPSVFGSGTKLPGNEISCENFRVTIFPVFHRAPRVQFFGLRQKFFCYQFDRSDERSNHQFFMLPMNSESQIELIFIPITPGIVQLPIHNSFLFSTEVFCLRDFFMSIIVVCARKHCVFCEAEWK